MRLVDFPGGTHADSRSQSLATSEDLCISCSKFQGRARVPFIMCSGTFVSVCLVILVSIPAGTQGGNLFCPLMGKGGHESEMSFGLEKNGWQINDHKNNFCVLLLEIGLGPANPKL